MDIMKFKIAIVLLLSKLALGDDFSTVDLLTFNTGLTPIIANYTDRRGRLSGEILNVNADVVCLQEVWYSDDLAIILGETGYPYSASALHRNKPPPAVQSAPCTNDASFPALFLCYQTNCSTVGEQAVIGCLLTSCDLLALTQQCRSCIVFSGVEKLEDKCLAGGYGTQINEPGLLLMSKVPLKNLQVKNFVEPQTNLFFVRSYILAEIKDVGKVACTHMTSIFSEYPYFERLDFTSWEGQNLAEAGILITELADADRVVLLGDLNTSPDIPEKGIVGEAADTYYRFIKEEMFTPMHNFTGDLCTYCDDNVLTDQLGSNILDHVFVRQITPRSAKRVFDDNSVCPLSDHYGVVVTLSTVE